MDGPSNRPPSPGRSGQSKQKKPPSITPRRFTRFFTPRSVGSAAYGTSRRVLFDITEKVNPRNGVQSSPIRGPTYDSVENGFSPLPVDQKRRKVSHESESEVTAEVASVPQIYGIPPTIQEEDESASTVAVAEESNGAILASLHTQTLKDSWSLTKSIHRPRHASAKKFYSRDLHGSLLGRELGVSRPGIQSPADDWENETANFYTTPSDVHDCNSIAPPFIRSAAIPFCVQGCNTSSYFAVGDEQGFVRISDSDVNKQSNLTKVAAAFQPHANAIIDIDFSQDDRYLATASGDQTGSIIDMITQKTVSILAGHRSSLKQVRFQPGKANHSVLATSSRDGSVQIWDLRCHSALGPVHQMHMPPPGQEAPRINYGHAYGTIDQAHTQSKCIWRTPTIGRRKTSGLQVLDHARNAEDGSITAIHFLPEGKEHLLLTASNQTAAVKLWDIRAVGSLRQQPPQALAQTAQPLSHKGYRDFGISSIALSTDGSRLFTVCRDNTIFAYSTAHLQLGAAPELTATRPDRHRFVQRTEQGLGPIYGYRHPALRVGSFFIKAAVRPAKNGKSELLAVGNSDGSTILIPTDTRYQASQPRRSEEDDDLKAQPDSGKGKGLSKRGQDGIPIYRTATALVRGSEKEVGAVAWTSTGELITADDSCIVRRWREGLNEARDLRLGGEGQGRRWNCGWAEASERWDGDFDDVDV